jgi:hypothetical protein
MLLNISFVACCCSPYVDDGVISGITSIGINPRIHSTGVSSTGVTSIRISFARVTSLVRLRHVEYLHLVVHCNSTGNFFSIFAVSRNFIIRSNRVNSCLWMHRITAYEKMIARIDQRVLFLTFFGWDETESTWYVGHC